MKSELKGLFSQKDLSPFTVQRNGINIVYLIGLYALSFAIMGLYEKFGNALYIIIGFLVMGAVQHTFATFVHEAAHLNLFTNRKMNDFFGHVLCAAPLISYMKDYRYFHFEHHRHTGKIDKDPELKFYRAMGVKPSYDSKAEVIKVFINDLTGISYFRGLLHVLKFFGEKRKAGEIENPTIIENLAVVAWLTAFPFLMFKLGLIIPYLIFWLAPIITLTPLLLRWHSFGEHIREKLTCASENTFTHKFSLIPTLFLYPINSSYHLEHHLYPQIPWYSLDKFYHWAKKNEVYARNSEKLTVDGYFFGKETILTKAFPIEK
jgi:fatty acid desaturase